MLQKLLVAMFKPYIRAEFPKWGALYKIVVGSSTESRLWASAPVVIGRNKIYGYESHYDLSNVGDRGLYFLGRWGDLPTQLMLSCFPFGTVVDVGGNRGDFTLAAAYLSERVITFEPNPEMAEFLTNDLMRNGIENVTVHQCGLSDESGMLSLTIPEMGAAGASFGGFPQGKTIDNIPIRVGDQVLAGESPVLIKIDVEGFEVRVIRGLQETIKRSQPVVITEVVPDHLERCGNSVAELKELMTGLGYSGFGMNLRRKGFDHELKLGGNSTDIAWLPKGRYPEEFRASHRDLRRRIRRA